MATIKAEVLSVSTKDGKTVVKLKATDIDGTLFGVISEKFKLPFEENPGYDKGEKVEVSVTRRNQ